MTFRSLKKAFLFKMVNIYDNANQLAKDLQETEQFKDLKKSLENLKNNPESLDLYQRMDKLQQQILAAQNSGQPLSEDVQKEYQKINEEVRNNDELKDMITKEQALFQMINDVQQAMTKPIGDLYDDLKAK